MVSVATRMVSGSSPDEPLATPAFEAGIQLGHRRLFVPATAIPSRSLPVHPSQIYAAISGLLLCGWTHLLREKTRKSGIVFAAGLIAYGFLRIIEEIIRVDEAGQFGTALSIAQWVSAAAILLGMLILWFANARGGK